MRALFAAAAALALVCGGCAAIETDRAYPPADCGAALESALGGPDMAARLRWWNPLDGEASATLLAQLGSRRQEIDDLAARCPRHAPTLFAAAVLAYAAGDREGAARGLDAVLALDPGHAGAASLRSRVAVEQGSLPLARRVLDRAIALRPSDPGLREAHASTLYLSGRLDEASVALDAAERFGAQAWRVAFNRGLIAEAAGRTADAAAQYRRAIEAKPSFDTARGRLAGLAVRQAP